jgi:hypothetical protein
MKRLEGDMKGNVIFLKILTVFLVVFFSGQVNGGQIIKSFDFSKSDLIFSKEKGYDKVRLNDASFTTDFGMPLLPAKVFYFVIPPYAEVSDVKVSSRTSIVLEGEYDLFPSQPPKSENIDFEWINPDLEVYSSTVPYPENLTKYIGEGYFAGYRIASILVFPLQYSPALKKLTIHSKIEVTLEYRSSINTSVPVMRKSWLNQELFRDMVNELVVNPMDVDINAPSISTVSTSKVEKLFITGAPSPLGTSVEYVIITSDALSSNFQTLADWKTKRGVPTVVRTTSWIQSNYPNGADLQETIRKFIADAYSNWGTVWILLGGDTDIIPPRYAHVNQLWYYGENIPADMYYACLDGNWNDDGDGIFGEAFYDSVDLYPEVFIGRAPVEDTSEANDFINKVKKYSDPDSTGYLTRALFLGTDMFTSGDGAAYCDSIAKRFPSAFDTIKLYENRGDENRQSVIDSLNSGFNLVYYQGHGGEYAFQVKRDMSGGGAHHEYINRADMDTLKNNGEFAVYYSVTCNSGAIDHDAVFERFLNNPNGGGVGAVTTTRADYPFTEFKFSETFFDSLFSSSNNNVRIGKTEAMSRLPFVGNAEFEGHYRFIQFSRILLADPEMDIWTGDPRCMSAYFPDSIPLGSNQFTVTVAECGLGPVASALVTLQKGNEDYGYGLTNGSGQISFYFTPETAGSLSIVVTKHNYLPYEGYSDVYVPKPYVAYHNFSIDDDTSGGSSGNNNGIIDAGETIELPLVVKNTGSDTAYSVDAVLSTSDLYVTILDSTESFGNILPGDTATSQNQFVFTSDTTSPDGHDFTFTVNLTYYPTDPPGNDTITSSDEFIPITYAPKLEHFAHTIVDTGCTSCDYHY